MTLLPILTAPDPFLKKKALPVTVFDAALAQMLDDMLETMVEAKGIGLAATQVGIDKRMLVMDVGWEEKGHPWIIINPVITWLSEEMSSYNEGCLSVPTHYSDVIRPAAVKITYQDKTGAPQTLHATGLLATCLQHEMDHLDGILFLDHLSSLKRTMILRKLIKKQKVSGAITTE
jgi:peptide deformylase